MESTVSTPVLTAPLQAGVTYLFEVSGTYQFAKSRSGTWADAEWMYYYSGLDENGNRVGELGIVEKRGGVAGDILDLAIDGKEVDWLGNGGSGWAAHTYSPSHVYQYYVTGNGSPVSLIIADWYPLEPGDSRTDNAGSLQVTVSAVPDGGSSFLLFGSAVALVGAANRKFRKVLN